MKLLPWRIARNRTDYEELFLQRYDRILKWACQVAGGDEPAAQDLVQDAYLHFTLARPPLDAVRNLDVYLYVVIRNLYRSRLATAQRARFSSFDLLEHDTAASTWRASSARPRTHVLGQLCRIAGYVSLRKETSTTASALILRFFHGLSPVECARLMGTSRSATDERLRAIRQEVRAWLKDPARIRGIGPETVTVPELRTDMESDEELLEALRGCIYETRRGECLSSAGLAALYPGATAPVPAAVLAHIVSCPTCLVRACAAAGIGQPPSGDGGNGSSSRRALQREWNQRRDRMLAEEPETLTLSMNGMPLCSTTLSGETHRLTIQLPVHEPVEFLEVWTGNETRLILLPILEQPPVGPSLEGGVIELANGCRVAVRVELDGPWPIATLEVEQPIAALAPRQPAPVCIAGIESSSWLPRFRLLPALASLLVVVLLLTQVFHAPMQAAEVLRLASAWERAAVSRNEPVLVRHFRLRRSHWGRLEADQSVSIRMRPGTQERCVELRTRAGLLVARERQTALPVALSLQNAWQFEPSAASFRRLAGSLEQVRVRQERQWLILEADAATLYVDGRTRHPERQVIRTGGYVFEFEEESHSTAPVLDPAPPRAAQPALRTDSVGPAAVLAPPDLNQVELDVRHILARAGYATTAVVRRRERDVEVELPVARQAARELGEALRAVPHVSLNFIDPRAAVEAAGMRLLAPDGSAEAVPARPLLEAELLAHFGTREAVKAGTARLLEPVRGLARTAGALRDLAARYPAGDAAQPLALELEQTAVRDLDQLRALWQQVPPLRSAVPAEAHARSCEDWRTRAALLADKAWELQLLSDRLLIGVAGEAPAEAPNPAVLVGEMERLVRCAH